jgi:membrane-associated phospholipid phosphatase
MFWRSFFHDLPRNVLTCFKGYNLLWHLLAIALTFVLVISGFDWFYFESSRSYLLREVLFPAVRLGSLMPVLAPLALSTFAVMVKSPRMKLTAGALAQAVLIGLLIAAFYKAFTGRVHPPRLFTPDTTDISGIFRFGFMRGGVFWGWPSSHTTVAFAMAVTLVKLYRGNRAVRYLALLYAFYIGFGVSATIHWFSDFVAGAILGSVVGVTVGNSLRDYRSEME